MDKLIDKLNKEFDDYEAHLFTLEKSEIFDHSYETAIKAEMVCLIEENADKLSEKLTNRLLGCNNALKFLYDTYMNDDSANIINELTTVIENLEFKIKSL